MSALTDAIDKSRSAAYPFDRFEGRGIVTCAGGLRYFTCAFVLISVLRKHFRCSLPIQVWHLGGREITDEMRLLLSEYADTYGQALIRQGDAEYSAEAMMRLAIWSL